MDIRRLFKRNQTSNLIYITLFASALLHVGLLVLYPPGLTATAVSDTGYRVIRLVDLREQTLQTSESAEPENLREIRISESSLPQPVRAKPLVRAEQNSAPQGAGGFYSQFSIDELPRIAREAPKIYPARARDNGKEGRVVLDIYIDAAGRIADIRIVCDPGYGLAEAAIAYVRGSVWEPAKFQGRTVPVRIRKPIVFHLNE